MVRSCASRLKISCWCRVAHVQIIYSIGRKKNPRPTMIISRRFNRQALHVYERARVHGSRCGIDLMFFGCTSDDRSWVIYERGKKPLIACGTKNNSRLMSRVRKKVKVTKWPNETRKIWNSDWLVRVSDDYGVYSEWAHDPCIWYVLMTNIFIKKKKQKKPFK